MLTLLWSQYIMSKQLNYYLGVRSSRNIGQAERRVKLLPSLGKMRDLWDKYTSRLFGGRNASDDKQTEFVELKDDDYRMDNMDSSNIHAVAYNPQTLLLMITFKSGSTYFYGNIPERIFDGLVGASSHGKYFWANIRNKNYPYEKVS